jgi:branched-chain amino acid aminotransferase
MSDERVLYLNGKYVKESDAKISLFDYGFQEGDGVFDMARTFNGTSFKLKEHICRLFQSLRYARLDPGLSQEQVAEISLKVLNLNEGLREEGGDYWICQTISRGNNWPLAPDSPTVAIYCIPIPFWKWASHYQTGVHAVITSTRRIPPDCVDPKVKVLSRMNLQLAQFEAERIDAGAYPLMLDIHGNVAEGNGVNFFMVKNGRLLTPTLFGILAGVSRETVIELAKKIGIEVCEDDFQPYDAYNADEAFFTTTSRCILPITKIDQLLIGDGKRGPITSKLLEVWSEMVGLDIVGQSTRFLKNIKVR